MAMVAQLDWAMANSGANTLRLQGRGSPIAWLMPLDSFPQFPHSRTVAGDVPARDLNHSHLSMSE
jgi:hypothetical protein